MISVVCCYNNEKEYAKLVSTLRMQTLSCEIIGVNNCKTQFKSAASALNYGALKASGDILLFLHQDIILYNEDYIKDFVDEIMLTSDDDIVGVAGAKYNSKNNISNIKHGINRAGFVTEVDELKECDTIDECFFGMRKTTWKNRKFDEQLCSGWHLYAVEYSLYTRQCGNKVYISSAKGLYHASKGNVTWSYYKNLLKIAKFYRNSFKHIWTTCGKINTGYMYCIYFFSRKKMGVLFGRLQK